MTKEIYTITHWYTYKIYVLCVCFINSKIEAIQDGAQCMNLQEKAIMFAKIADAKVFRICFVDEYKILFTFYTT